MEYAENFDLTNIVTPVYPKKLLKLLRETSYDESESMYLYNRFKTGFDIGYWGPAECQSRSRNIPSRIGNEVELWNKLIKEIKLNRVARPFDKVPYDNFIQSPIGLVPKDGNSGKTRLIFHVSYNFNDQEKSLNQHTLTELCSVKYNDLDHAVQNCLKVNEQRLSHLQSKPKGNPVQFHDEIDSGDDDSDNENTGGIFLGKTDIQSAFCLVPLAVWCFAWLTMVARNPKTRKWQIFIDKRLPFCASISCAIFRRFSNALCHITKIKSRSQAITNYLDDFLFVSYTLQ